MGDFETLDIDYAIEVEPEDGEKTSDVFNKAYGWVNEKVGEEIEKARAASQVNVVKKRAGKVVND